MGGTLLLVLTCLPAALGFALIALSQKQHGRLIRPRGVGLSSTPLRLCGAGLIGAAAAPAVARDGWAFGLLVWATMLTVASLLVVVVLASLRRQGGGQRDDE